MLVALAPLVAYAMMWRYFTEVPIIDDYPHIFSFALAFHSAPTFSHKLGLILTTQVGPYKLIFDHSLIALELWLTGKLHFPILILLGNLTLPCIAALLWQGDTRPEVKREYRALYFVPVTLLLFSLNYAETVNWAISGLQQPAVIMFSLASLYFLTKPQQGRGDLFLAYGFALIASTTYANGMILWPVGLCFLLLANRRDGRLLAWSLAFAAALGFYLFRYQAAAPLPHTAALTKAIFYVMFCGSAIENMHHRPIPFISLAIGLGVLAVVADSVRTRYDRRNPFYFYSAVWILLTAVVVTSARVSMGLQLSLSSRYKIYCDLLLIYCYNYLLHRFSRTQDGIGTVKRQNNFLGISIAVALLVNVAGDVGGARFLATRRSRAETAMQHYVADPEHASPMFLVEDTLSPEEMQQEDLARQQLNEAIRTGIYDLPKH